ncbi:hypothetical protein BGW38_007114, partial [Lunasporangiospora selenospora]
SSHIPPALSSRPMTSPIRWTLVVLSLLLLFTLAFSKISARSDATGRRLSKRGKPSLLLHHLQEEQILRNHYAQLQQDLEENDLQLELDCSTPPASSPTDSSAALSADEIALQKADFELELALEVQKQAHHSFVDGTVLNESPSALQRHLARKLKKCIAWRAQQQQQHQQQQQRLQQLQQKILMQQQSSSKSQSSSITATAAISRFQLHHPDRQDVLPDSIFGQTLVALSQRRYRDPNGYVVELDPIKAMADYHRDAASDGEADLFRRTTVHQCLDQEPRRSRFYPLSESGGIYCPNQAVFRHGGDRSYDFMDRFEWISVASVSRIPMMETREKDGGLGGVQFLEGEDDLLRRRILAAMKLGVSEGHDALVLPPHGTDVGQNPAEAIAAIYRSIIGRDFMGGRKRFQTYKKIVMVLDPEQAYKVVNETSSYRPTKPPAPTVTATPLPVDEDEADEQDEQEDAEEKSADAEEGEILLDRRSADDADDDEGEYDFGQEVFASPGQSENDESPEEGEDADAEKPDAEDQDQDNVEEPDEDSESNDADENGEEDDAIEDRQIDDDMDADTDEGYGVADNSFGLLEKATADSIDENDSEADAED